MDHRQPPTRPSDPASPEPHERPQSSLSDAELESARLKALLHHLQEREGDARRALRLLVSIVDELPVGLRVQAEDGTTIFANGAAREFYGDGPATFEAAALEPAPPPAPALETLAAAALDEADAPASAKDRVTQDHAPQNHVAQNPVTQDHVAEDHVGHGENKRTLLKSSRPARIFDRALTLSASIDFTKRKEVEAELSKRANFDDLTGLPNRALVQDQVHRLLAEPERNRRFALAFIDIDNFKHINDYYTHAIGDALLVKVAQRISANIRPSDTIARISGDEFLLVLNPVDSDDNLAQVVEKLLQELKEPFLIEGFEILTSASIGVSIFPDHGVDYETLRRAADTAMYRIKGGSKGGAALFAIDMGRDMTVRMAQEQRLRLALRDGRFCCAFQPKVDIRTEEIAGVEALIRLRDADGLIQAPGGFIGLAGELGLINELTYLALDRILSSMDMIDEHFGQHATVSINVAAKQAGDPKFMSGFCEELASSPHARRFIVEVTEDAVVAKGLFQTDVLPMLRDIGVRVSIDDFGTGYSSLAVLADITADEIKIDRSFIKDIHNRSRSQSVLKAIEALSEPLGMTMIAEGVETYEELAYLQAASRIRYAQGFYFSKPIFMEDLSPTRGLVQRAFESPRERALPRGYTLRRR
jgi:diguanylate cyclase (GGDEF)-like protein